MQFDRGYLSPNFVTNTESMTVELDKPFIFIHEDKIDSIKQIVPVLEKVVESKKPLLIIAEDITGEALSTLVINKLRGVAQVCAVKAPGYGDRRKAMALRRSPYPGALTAQTWATPRSLLITSVDRASPVMSSAMISSGFFDSTTFSRTGTICLIESILSS